LKFQIGIFSQRQALQRNLLFLPNASFEPYFRDKPTLRHRVGMLLLLVSALPICSETGIAELLLPSNAECTRLKLEARTRGAGVWRQC